MRIIAGEFRGRRLLPPASPATRPITDRVKQSLFDILTPQIPGAVVYDCFAGTGSLGLESLSRGASRATFFERDRDAVARLKQNIQMLGLQDRARVVSGDLFKWFMNAARRPAEADRADLVFLDPPYRFVRDLPEQLRALARELSAHHLSDRGIVVFRHDARDSLELPMLVRYDRRDYGGMTIELLRRAP
ncbi:16S rRNA (guanine(966)-N(2))-methyltransferase RsmD [Fontivita pretiosa]|uniref:16S rRNA (guanine(966)-N(2))-methyltransferase RsmD n=1 Tax=Fontivita pretiosa TaxID=2989684 RepID=UPI003D16D6A0